MGSIFHLICEGVLDHKLAIQETKTTRIPGLEAVAEEAEVQDLIIKKVISYKFYSLNYREMVDGMRISKVIISTEHQLCLFFALFLWTGLLKFVDSYEEPDNRRSLPRNNSSEFGDRKSSGYSSRGGGYGGQGNRYENDKRMRCFNFVH